MAQENVDRLGPSVCDQANQDKESEAIGTHPKLSEAIRRLKCFWLNIFVCAIPTNPDQTGANRTKPDQKHIWRVRRLSSTPLLTCRADLPGCSKATAGVRRRRLRSYPHLSGAIRSLENFFPDWKPRERGAVKNFQLLLQSLLVTIGGQSRSRMPDSFL